MIPPMYTIWKYSILWECILCKWPFGAWGFSVIFQAKNIKNKPNKQKKRKEKVPHNGVKKNKQKNVMSIQNHHIFKNKQPLTATNLRNARQTITLALRGLKKTLRAIDTCSSISIGTRTILTCLAWSASGACFTRTTGPARHTPDLRWISQWTICACICTCTGGVLTCLAILTILRTHVRANFSWHTGQTKTPWRVWLIETRGTTQTFNRIQATWKFSRLTILTLLCASWRSNCYRARWASWYGRTRCACCDWSFAGRT